MLPFQVLLKSCSPWKSQQGLLLLLTASYVFPLGPSERYRSNDPRRRCFIDTQSGIYKILTAGVDIPPRLVDHIGTDQRKFAFDSQHEMSTISLLEHEKGRNISAPGRRQSIQCGTQGCPLPSTSAEKVAWVGGRQNCEPIDKKKPRLRDNTVWFGRGEYPQMLQGDANLVLELPEAITLVYVDGFQNPFSHLTA